MTPMNPRMLSPNAQQVFKRIEFDKDERLLFEVRKHWFGLFLIYAVGGFVTFASLVAAVVMAVAGRNGANSGIASIQMPVILISFMLAVLAVFGTALGVYIYKSNIMLVTSDKVAQMLAYGIFHRKISQLSIGDVQDVTVRQHGLFPHAFNYGTVVIETAGEQSNYTFHFAPDPYECSKAIVTAHEENLKLHGN